MLKERGKEYCRGGFGEWRGRERGQGLVSNTKQQPASKTKTNFSNMEEEEEEEGPPKSCPALACPPADIIARLQSCPTNNLHHHRQLHAALIRSPSRKALRLPFHWNCLMRPYARLSHLAVSALRLYPLMARSGVPPDCYTLPILFKALSSSHDHHLFPPAHRTSLGRQLHGVAIRHGLAAHEFSETGLISVYAKSGCLDQALQVFDQNPHRKLGSWNALIAGYAQAGHSRKLSPSSSPCCSSSSSMRLVIAAAPMT